MLSILVQDSGFYPWSHVALSLNPLCLDGHDNPEDVDLKAVDEVHGNIIIISFASFSDGRGFSLAHHLRLKGFEGQIYASGHIIGDQYRHARQSGFDGVLLTQDQAHRMPEPYWREQAKRVGLSYRDKIYA